MREFILSCSYGVLAGTLVGAATLAFSDKPGDNLNKVARGASIGLYAGILLGAYVVYGVPGGASDEDDDEPVAFTTPSGTRIVAGLKPKTMSFKMREPSRFALMPHFSFEKGLEGATAHVRVLTF